MRDDFTQTIKDTLAKRVGGFCSNPTCTQSTYGPRIEDSASVSIGVASHITAASLGGPRYDETLSQEQRSGITNGIWLCQNCAKLIDNDQNRFTTEILRDWKQSAEQRALERISGISVEIVAEDHRSYEFVQSASNQTSPALAYLEFRRFENLYFPREEMPALFDVAQIETDGAGIKIGWDVVEISQERFGEFELILEKFSRATIDIQKQRKLGHHLLSAVACGGTTSENEALSEKIRKLCESTGSGYGIRVLIGYMAGIRYVDCVLIAA